jgi:cytochrome b involved in lipid metabolism
MLYTTTSLKFCSQCLSELGFETPYSLEDAFRNTVTEMAEHLNRQAVRAHGLKHVGRYTRTQVAVHNNSKDLWVVIDGRIYDLTAFIELHPGGEDAIFQNAGGDARRVPYYFL